MNKIAINILIFVFLTAIKITSQVDKKDLSHGDKIIKEMGIISTSSSPFSKLHDVPIHAVKIYDGFWSPRLRKNKDVSIPKLLELLEEHGVVDNFRRLSGRKNVKRRGALFTDSDLFKWMEAAAIVLQSENDAKLKATLDSIIDDVLAAQGEDGYLNTFHQKDVGEKRFTNFYNNHELYCLGHLIQAGIAYYRATGDKKLLNGASKYVDYVISLFGPGKKQCFAGHPEIEMALVELYRTTREKKYLNFADYLLNHVELDKLEEKHSNEDYDIIFSGLPFTSRKEFKSHSVRGMYACCGATDLYMETGDSQLWKTLEILWKDMTQYKMYVTGGVGSRYIHEAFGNKYELPNERAYTETCAAIGNIMLNWRMLNASGEARFAEIMERAFYNGFLSGVSLKGDTYFYRNPLVSFGDNVRQPWYNTTCCPPNIQRTFAKLPGYLYSTSKEGVWINFYQSSELNWHLENGKEIKLTQTTNYPWKNTVDIKVNSESKEFSIFVRIPEWTPKAYIFVNDKLLPEIAAPSTYFEIHREWKKNDHIRLEFEMPIRIVFPNPRIREDLGTAALQRGPVVYCLESSDYTDVSIFDIVLPLNSSDPKVGFNESFNKNLLGGVIMVKKQALIYKSSLEEEPLYSYATFEKPTQTIELTAIPYYAWANRGPSQMQVWIPWIEKH